VCERSHWRLPRRGVLTGWPSDEAEIVDPAMVQAWPHRGTPWRSLGLFALAPLALTSLATSVIAAGTRFTYKP
jgi:hypothetical protein